MPAAEPAAPRDRPLRVLLDATAVPADRGGVGRYVDGLVSASSDGLIIACQARDVPVFERLAPTATLVVQSPRIRSTALRLIWEQVSLPRLARRLDVDVIHSPHYTMPLATGVPRVVTFHDATFFSDPAVHTSLKRRFFRMWIRISARRAAAVVVPSQSTAEELRRFVTLRRPVHVAYHGVDPLDFHAPSESERAAFAARHGLTRPWIAFLGTLEPRKNLSALIRAYRHLTDRRDGQATDFPMLVLAGGRGWDEQLDRLLADRTGEGQVQRLGYVPAEELSALLGGAAVVAYPSLGEGFGLPVLEAMACGACVLTTRRLALPEVGGDAVQYTDVDDASIAQGLGALLDDADLRSRFSSAASARAMSFTWARSAAEHASAYRDAVSR